MTTTTAYDLPQNWDANVEGFGRPFVRRTLLQRAWKFLFGNARWI